MLLMDSPIQEMSVSVKCKAGIKTWLASPRHVKVWWPQCNDRTLGCTVLVPSCCSPKHVPTRTPQKASWGPMQFLFDNYFQNNIYLSKCKCFRITPDNTTSFLFLPVWICETQICYSQIDKAMQLKLCLNSRGTCFI